MERWNWFLSANALGRWIITHGYAEATQSDDIIRAFLWHSSDTPYFAYVEITDSVEGKITAAMKYYNPETPPHTLHGNLYRDDVLTANSAETIVLTDGAIILGLAKGPQSDEGNYA